MSNISDQFADAFVEHTVDLLRVSESMRGDVASMLQDLGDDLEEQIRKGDIAGIQRTAYQLKRQEALLKQTKATIATAYRDVDTKVSSELVSLADVAKDRTIALTDEVFGASIVSVNWTKGDLQELVTDSMIQGAPQRDWWSKQGDDLQDRFSQQIRMGVSAGETNEQLVQRIRGTDSGQRRVVDVDGEKTILKEYTGGVMNTSRRQAETLVRTSVQTVSNNVNMRVFQDNDDIIKGIQWLSTLDNRTTEYCMGMDGGAWDFDGDPLEDSTVDEKFPGNPPAHWNCRSVLIPVTYSWDELIAKQGGDSDIHIEEIPESTRASMDGQVAADLNYEDWLKTKPEAFQQEVLGPTKWEMWKKGDLDFTAMADQSGRALSIDELRDKIAGKTPAEMDGPELRDRMDKVNDDYQGKLDDIQGERDALEKQHGELLEQLKALDDNVDADQAKIDDLEKKIGNVNVKYRDAIDAKVKVKDSLNTSIQALLQVKDPINMNIVTDGLKNKNMADKAAKAEQFLDSIISKTSLPTKWMDEIPILAKYTTDYPRAAELGLESRAFQDAGVIYMTPQSDIGTWVHEAGHVLDNGDVLTQTKAFLAKRAGTSKLELMSDLLEGDYKSWERAWPDEFINPYMGKRYDNATEILSMGLEMLYRDPMKLATEDPEYFDFIIKIIRGL